MKLFEVDDKSSIPIWVQLKNRFIYLIASGHFHAGDQLPTVRGLAAEIEVNYNTVSKVYKSLEADGYVESNRQGVFVLDIGNKPGVSIVTTAHNMTRDYFKRCLELGMSLEDIVEQFNVVLRGIQEKVGGNGATKQAKHSNADSRVIEFGKLPKQNKRSS